jgi:RNA polymerase-binding transcription factor DksA
MAIKKKQPVKAIKKAVPKKTVKPAAKKVAAKKAVPAKPVKKDSTKKNSPVAKKPAATVSKSKTPVPVKKPVHAAPATKKPGAPIAASSAQAKKHITAPLTGRPTFRPGPAPAAAVAKPAPVVVAPKPYKPEEKSTGFKQQVKNTSPVSVKPEVKKVAPPVAKATKIVMPEIKTKSVRKYEPEFTRSVLDTHHQEQTGPTMRYSDSELNEFKELISKKMDSAKKELTYLQGLITRRDEMGGDETDNRYMTMEDGSMSMEREQLSQMASRQITFIDHLEKAMMRIENKTYGICRVTGKLIDKARLKAVPHATLSIEAKQTMNK